MVVGVGGVLERVRVLLGGGRCGRGHLVVLLAGRTHLLLVVRRAGRIRLLLLVRYETRRVGLLLLLLLLLLLEGRNGVGRLLVVAGGDVVVGGCCCGRRCSHRLIAAEIGGVVGGPIGRRWISCGRHGSVRRKRERRLLAQMTEELAGGRRAGCRRRTRTRCARLLAAAR
jgi:hypothetical protein